MSQNEVNLVTTGLVINIHLIKDAMSSNSFAFVGSVFTISSGRSFRASSESPVTLNDMFVPELCESSLKCILRMRRFEEIHLLTNERTGTANHLALAP